MSAKRLLLVNIIVILVIIIGGFTAYYFYNQSTLYLKTDDATVSGQQVVIAAPATGKLVSWDGQVGNDFTSGESVGQIAVAGAPKPINVTMPQDATVVQNEAVQNEIVAAGTPLAYAYNMSNLWITANIKETQISDVKVGQTVDVYVDAFPGVSLKGTVKQIGLATASTFSLLPSSNDTANYTKVTQVIPVQISLQGDQGIGLVPGMNATVRIHKS